MKDAQPPEPSASGSAPPPSYNESLSSPTSIRSPTSPPNYGSSLRSAHISNLVDDSIMNHVRQSAMNGIASTTQIFVPSNVWSLKHKIKTDSYAKEKPDYRFPGEKVVGFPSKDEISIERLLGPDQKLEFWRQASVVKELSLQIRRALEADGYSVIDHIAGQESISRHRAGSSSLELKPVEWKAIEQRPLHDEEARNTTELKEVTVRLENEMGLYETRSGMALVVKTEIGGIGEEDVF